MKKNLLIASLLIANLSTWAAAPTDADLAQYHTSGQVCICIQFAYPVCNDIVWCGTYNNWNTNDVDNLIKFQPVIGFDGWYVVSFNDNSSDIRGKAVQLNEDGSFNWKYQTGDVTTWTILSGTATPTAGSHTGESELQQIDKTNPLIVTSSKWKNIVCKAPSKTLPVLYINTMNQTPITSKDEYLYATYYFDSLSTTPDTLQIKGRGNWTWSGFDKKPYRLKLSNKQALLGMNKNKHWTLLAHADDNFCWMKNTVGFYLSEQLGMKWTPKQAPVEVVLNGDYIGLYMLTEQIRIDKKRVNIMEQADNCTNSDSITGGWLVEIDNYQEPYHVTIYEPSNQWQNGQTIWITPKTPEILSTPQTNYLLAQMNGINTALYEQTEENLVNILDMDEAARFYLVQELMSDCESYHGSCYLYKNANANQKWYFGPVWDFGNSFRDENKYIYDKPYFSQNWIGQLAGKNAFIASRDSLWKHWKYYDYSHIQHLVDSFATLIQDAATADALRWPQYNHADVTSGKNSFMDMFDRHVTWLTTQWGEGQPTAEPSIMNYELRIKKVIINGQLYIIRDEKVFTIMGSGTSIGKLPR